MPDEPQPAPPDDYAELPDDAQEAGKILHERALRKLGTVFWMGLVANVASCAGCQAADGELAWHDGIEAIGVSLGTWLFLYTVGYAILWGIFMIHQSAGKL